MNLLTLSCQQHNHRIGRLRKNLIVCCPRRPSTGCYLSKWRWWRCLVLRNRRGLRPWTWCYRSKSTGKTMWLIQLRSIRKGCMRQRSRCRDQSSCAKCLLWSSSRRSIWLHRIRSQLTWRQSHPKTRSCGDEGAYAGTTGKWQWTDWRRTRDYYVLHCLYSRPSEIVDWSLYSFWRRMGWSNWRSGGKCWKK